MEKSQREEVDIAAATAAQEEVHHATRPKDHIY